MCSFPKYLNLIFGTELSKRTLSMCTENLRLRKYLTILFLQNHITESWQRKTYWSFAFHRWIRQIILMIFSFLLWGWGFLFLNFLMVIFLHTNNYSYLQRARYYTQLAECHLDMAVCQQQHPDDLAGCQKSLHYDYKSCVTTCVAEGAGCYGSCGCALLDDDHA